MGTHPVSPNDVRVLSITFDHGQTCTLSASAPLVPETAIPASEPLPGFNLLLLDRNGRVLRRYPIPGLETQWPEHLAASHPASDSRGPLEADLPVEWPAGTFQATVMRGEHRLCQSDLSSAAPQIRKLAMDDESGPGDTSRGLHWESTKRHGDPVPADVDIWDGKRNRWHRLADAPGSDAALRAEDILPLGLPTPMLIRVSARDGLHVSEAFLHSHWAPTPTSAPHGAPGDANGDRLAILQPAQDAIIVPAATFVLEAMIVSYPDDRIDASQIAWISDRDGEIGRGKSLLVPSAYLSIGPHLISLTATSRTGVHFSRSVGIEVRGTTQPSAATIAQLPQMVVQAPGGQEMTVDR